MDKWIKKLMGGRQRSAVEQPKGPAGELKQTWEHFEKLDKTEDPLNSWHGDNRFAYGEGDIVDETSIDTANRNKWQELENMAEPVVPPINDALNSSDFIFPEDFDDYRSYRKAVENFVANPVDTAAPENLPFEERDILAESIQDNKKRITKKRGTGTSLWDQHQKELADEVNRKKNIEQAMEYTPAEFVLMQKAARFQAMHRMMPEILDKRPTFVDKTPMTDEQILTEVSRYHLDVVRNKNRQKYQPEEIAFMKSCEAWYDIASKAENYQQIPQMADGTPMNGDQIKELADEYRSFRKQNPAEFSKMQFLAIAESNVERKIWKRAEFVWVHSTFKGKDQWTCTKQVSDKDGSKISCRYVTNEDPAAMGSLSGTYYFTVRHAEKDPKDPKRGIAFINLHVPQIQKRTAAIA